MKSAPVLARILGTLVPPQIGERNELGSWEVEVVEAGQVVVDEH